MQVTIDAEIPDGYEATGEYRQPKKGEYFLNKIGIPSKAPVDFKYLYIILRKKWEWPEWLIIPWIARDRNGKWFGYQSKPIPVADQWYTEAFTECLSDTFLFELDLPDVPWKDSLMKNPHLEEQCK